MRASRSEDIEDDQNLPKALMWFVSAAIIIE
jgi:hypothetical protein